MSQWSVPLTALAAKAMGAVDEVVRKSTLELFRSVILKSPVDTGRFRGAWAVSYGAPNYSVGEVLDKTSINVDSARAKAEVEKVLTLPVGGLMYLSNGLPYAARLEYGWSQQAPAGMVRLSVIEFQNIVLGAIAATK